MATKRLARYARGFTPEGRREGVLSGPEKAGLGPHATILARLEETKEPGSWAACRFGSGKPLEPDCCADCSRAGATAPIASERPA